MSLKCRECSLMIHRHYQITSVTIQELFFAIYDVIFGKICIKLDKDPALRIWWLLEAAIYFQQREDTIDKAVLLYHRAGNLAKAIELVFKVRFCLL